MRLYPDILSACLDNVAEFQLSTVVKHRCNAIARALSLWIGNCIRQHLPESEQLCDIVGNRQQM
jgi:hypothetical protein